MKLFFWKKDTQETNSAYAAFEEIDAKRTSRLGYFFLILMVIFGVIEGQGFLDAVKNSITSPEANSYCLTTLAQYAKVENVHNSYNPYYGSYGYYNTNEQGCVFSTREIKLSINTLYEKIAPLRLEMNSVSKTIDDLTTQINQSQQYRESTISEYDVSLQEKMAVTENAVFDPNGLQGTITATDVQIRQLQSQLASVNERKTALENQIEAIVVPFSNILQKAFDQYAHDVDVYQFEQFLLSFIFIAPLFYFAWSYYHRLKNRRSEYTIIWGGIVATVGIIFAQILLVFVYEILPQEILQKIFEFFSAFKILWALLYWFGFILVPLFFGFLIYLIQKKFYNKKAVMMRALKNEHCPNCSLKINRMMNNCPVCGYTLKTKCHSCGSMSMDGGLFCESCGIRRISNEVVS